MLLLTATTDKIQLVTSAAVTVDVHASFMDSTNGDPPAVKGSTSGRQNTAVSTATTTDIVAAPASSTLRNVKTLHIRNKHASSSVDVTVIYDQNGTDYEIHKATLLAGDLLEYVEGIGFFTVTSTTKLDVRLRVPSDSVHATAATFADVTGLTYPVLTGKHYNFECHLYHISNATTTGAQFGINGPSMTALLLSTIDTVTGSVTASAHSAGSVSALNTAATAQTTGSAAITMAILSGWINPSADGTFAIRATSEVSVAAGLTVKAGSWLRLWEPNA
jgi:hypothetical protein